MKLARRPSGVARDYRALSASKRWRNALHALVRGLAKHLVLGNKHIGRTGYRTPLRTWAALPTALTALLFVQTVFGHGCIAVSGGGFCPLDLGIGLTQESGYLQPGDWRAFGIYRWFRSDRHFIGDDEFTLPNERDHEAINEAHYFELNLQRALTERVSVALIVPFVLYTRSTVHEHQFTGRYKTSASGLGDMRLTAYYWLIDPSEDPKGNLALGFGPKFPTGEFDAKDTFYTYDGPVGLPVDQSIQPGDGGWGFSLELDAFYRLSETLNGYLQGYYLFNPGNTNGVDTLIGDRNPYEAVNSISDQYVSRLGLAYAVYPKWGLTLGLGGRIEGVPVRDAIGGSDGFRRPGYAVFIEPSLNIAKNEWNFTLEVPVAVYRNRLQSVADQKLSDLTGIYIHGDAAFADYLVTASLSYKF